LEFSSKYCTATFNMVPPKGWVVLMAITKEQLLSELSDLGVVEGDLLFVTANLGSVGYLASTRSQTMKDWVSLLLTAVGEQGTVVVAAYTASFLRFKKDSKVVFSAKAKSNSGPISSAFLDDPRSVRSDHPTSSYVGIGPLAETILRDRDSAAMSYTPIGKMVALGAKNLMLGTVDKDNAPMCFHYAQEQLGITKTEPSAGWTQSYVELEGAKRTLFTRDDVGGCSRGAHNLYGKLLAAGAMRVGLVGNSTSALIDGRTSLDIIRKTLQVQRQLVLCEDQWCMSCYGRWSNVGIRVLWFYIIKLARQAILRLR
jgi:aminoglycoside 3-N-acetyltransferase